MSVGAVDANGVWIYGEDDRPDGTGSGLLNLGQTKTSIAIGLLKARAPYLWANSAARTAQTGMALGDRGTQHDTGVVYRYSGSAWLAWDSDWISYTPAIANFTIGTGGAALKSAFYKYEQGRVRVKGVGTLGTAGGFGVSGNPQIDLPVPALAVRHAFQQYPGSSTCYDVSAVLEYHGVVAANNAVVTNFLLLLSGTNGVRQGLSSTIPFTWTSGDSISWDFAYDPA